jgi:uncharacterized membrane protein YqjE
VKTFYIAKAHGCAPSKRSHGRLRVCEFQEDAQKLNPLHLIVVGIGFAAVFVVGLIFLVEWAVVVAQ